MKIVLEYRNPTPSHCDVVLFVNGAFTGSLCMRQEELLAFQQIISDGCASKDDTFLSVGVPSLTDPVYQAFLNQPTLKPWKETSP